MTILRITKAALLSVSFLGILLFSFAPSGLLHAQTNYKVDDISFVKLKGTSPLHNWSMTGRHLTGTARFNLSADNQLSSISDFSLRLPVRNLKGENAAMEKSTYKTLKEDSFKYIDFALTSARFKPSGSDDYILLLQGNLTIAGVTRPTTLRVSAEINPDSTISCTGSLPVHLSDFDIDRPSFLLGAMKVGNVLILSYRVLLIKW